MIDEGNTKAYIYERSWKHYGIQPSYIEETYRNKSIINQGNIMKYIRDR